eukprot:scaffold4390_cov264-Pinguiococcus_pyrenoidosus.AAC.7
MLSRSLYHLRCTWHEDRVEQASPQPATPCSARQRSRPRQQESQLDKHGVDQPRQAQSGTEQS